MKCIVCGVDFFNSRFQSSGICGRVCKFRLRYKKILDSRTVKEVAYKKKNRPKVTLTCQTCGSLYETITKGGKPVAEKYCSRTCIRRGYTTSDHLDYFLPGEGEKLLKRFTDAYNEGVEAEALRERFGERFNRLFRRMREDKYRRNHGRPPVENRTWTARELIGVEA